MGTSIWHFEWISDKLGELGYIWSVMEHIPTSLIVSLSKVFRGFSKSGVLQGFLLKILTAEEEKPY